MPRFKTKDVTPVTMKAYDTIHKPDCKLVTVLVTVIEERY